MKPAVKSLSNFVIIAPLYRKKYLKLNECDVKYMYTPKRNFINSILIDLQFAILVSWQLITTKDILISDPNVVIPKSKLLKQFLLKNNTHINFMWWNNYSEVSNASFYNNFKNLFHKGNSFFTKSSLSQESINFYEFKSIIKSYTKENKDKKFDFFYAGIIFNYKEFSCKIDVNSCIELINFLYPKISNKKHNQAYHDFYLKFKDKLSESEYFKLFNYSWRLCQLKYFIDKGGDQDQYFIAGYNKFDPVLQTINLKFGNNFILKEKISFKEFKELAKDSKICFDFGSKAFPIYQNTYPRMQILNNLGVQIETRIPNF